MPQELTQFAVDQSLLKELAELIRSGAGTRDIHGTAEGGFATKSVANEEFVKRELDRVRLHQNSLCRLLEDHLTDIDSILDVGCGTGGTTVAMGLSKKLAPSSLTGIDPDHTAIDAATIRARAYGLQDKVSFLQVDAGTDLPFKDGQFSLVTCISVLEFINDLEDRIGLVHEMCRVTAPGGFIVVCTPSPMRLREFHSHRLLGDFRKKAGFPWSSTPRRLREMFQGYDVTFLFGEQIEMALSRRGLPGARLSRRLPRVPLLLPWQKIIVKKPLSRIRPPRVAPN